MEFIPTKQQTVRNSKRNVDFDRPDETTITALRDETIQADPRLGVWQLSQDMSALTQGVIPAPRLDRLQYSSMPEFTIPNQGNLDAHRNQIPHIIQQRHLFTRTAVPTITPHPRPSQRQHPPSVGHAHDKQPMMRTDFGGVQHQMDVPCRACRRHNAPRDWLIPRSYSNCAIIQKAFQASDDTHFLGTYRHMGRDASSVHTSCPKDAHHQIGHIHDPAVAFSRPQLHKRQVQTTIQALKGLYMHEFVRSGFDSHLNPIRLSSALQALSSLLSVDQSFYRKAIRFAVCRTDLDDAE